MAKQIVKITKGKLTEIVSESIKTALYQPGAQNTPFFDSYDSFLKFLKRSDNTIEYLYLSKEKTGLNVDIYIDDCSSYKRHQHPLWAYFCDGYSHNDRLIPISISKDPVIEIHNCDINLSSIDLNSVRRFIRQNLQLIKDIADERIDSVEFVTQITKCNMQFCVAEKISLLTEMAKIENKFSHLGFDIFIDATPRITNHKEYRLKYPINKDAEQGNKSLNFVPMSICENPEFLPPSKVNEYNSIADLKRKKMMQDFIIRHCVELQAVSDGIKDLNDYKLELQAQTHPIKKQRKAKTQQLKKKK